MTTLVELTKVNEQQPSGHRERGALGRVRGDRRGVPRFAVHEVPFPLRS